jgi:hypothetical protein
MEIFNKFLGLVHNLMKTKRLYQTIPNAQWLRIVYNSNVMATARLRDLSKQEMFTPQREALEAALVELDNQRVANPDCNGVMGLFKGMDIQVDFTKKP